MDATQVGEAQATVTAEQHVHHHKHKHIEHKEETQMGQVLDVQELGGGAGLGGGLGSGLLGGILAGALFGNNRFNQNNPGIEGCVTPSQLTAALAGVQDTQMNTAVLQQLGAIQASVPLAESQVQLALAGSTATTTAGQATINKNISDAIAASLASQNNINVNVLQTSTANLMATKDAQAALTIIIKDDGEKTRALITAQNEANLQRQLAVAEAALLEQRADFRARASEINVTQTVNQNQAQVQAQAQQQQQAILLATLIDRVNGLQNAVATNSNLIVGNTGAVATGPQTANPVNVKA